MKKIVKNIVRIWCLVICMVALVGCNANNDPSPSGGIITPTPTLTAEEKRIVELEEAIAKEQARIDSEKEDTIALLQEKKDRAASSNNRVLYEDGMTFVNECARVQTEVSKIPEEWGPNPMWAEGAPVDMPGVYVGKEGTMGSETIGGWWTVDWLHQDDQYVNCVWTALPVYEDSIKPKYVETKYNTIPVCWMCHDSDGKLIAIAHGEIAIDPDDVLGGSRWMLFEYHYLSLEELKLYPDRELEWYPAGQW